MKPKPWRRYSPEYFNDWILVKNFPQGAGRAEIFSLNILCIKATVTYQMDMKTLLAVLMERVFFTIPSFLFPQRVSLIEIWWRNNNKKRNYTLHNTSSLRNTMFQRYVLFYWNNLKTKGRYVTQLYFSSPCVLKFMLWVWPIQTTHEAVGSTLRNSRSLGQI